jgi:hypothetical protein
MYYQDMLETYLLQAYVQGRGYAIERKDTGETIAWLYGAPYTHTTRRRVQLVLRYHERRIFNDGR